MCPACEQKFRNKSVIYWFDQAGKFWSDGYRSNDIAHEIPLITRCDECFVYFWIAPVHKPLSINSKMVRMELNPLDLSGNIRFKQVRKLTTEEFAEALALKKYEDQEEEKYLRKHLWWAINHPKRQEVPDEVSPELHSLFEENLETLIYKTPPESHENLIELAEMNRELGLFNESEKFLNRIVNGYSRDLVLKMREKIEMKNKMVFQV